MDHPYPDSAWAAHMTELRGTFQATYDAMTHLLDETTRQWDADLEAMAAALDQMRQLDRQRRQILNEVAQRMARMHALWLRTTLGPEPAAIGVLETRPSAAAPPLEPAITEAPSKDAAPPMPPPPESTAAPEDPPAAQAPPPDPVVWADGASPPSEEPTIPWVDDPVPERGNSPKGDDPTVPVPPATLPPFANPAADAAPGGEPVLPRLVQSF